MPRRCRQVDIIERFLSPQKRHRRHKNTPWTLNYRSLICQPGVQAGTDWPSVKVVEIMSTRTTTKDAASILKLISHRMNEIGWDDGSPYPKSHVEHHSPLIANDLPIRVVRSENTACTCISPPFKPGLHATFYYFQKCKYDFCIS